MRLFYYLFKAFSLQENPDSSDPELLSYIPFLAFRNYRSNAPLPVSFIQEYPLNPSKFLDVSAIRLSEDSLEKYRFFLRVNPGPGVFLNSLLMKHVNKKFVKVLESLQRVYVELLAESLYYSNYKLFSFYLKHLRTIEGLPTQALRTLFELVLDILEEQETFEVFYSGHRFIPNERILNKLKSLASLNENKGKNGLELMENDEENILLKGKIIEALLANGKLGYLGLLNELEEKHVMERNRKSALPIGFLKLKSAGCYLERNRNEKFLFF